MGVGCCEDDESPCRGLLHDSAIHHRRPLVAIQARFCGSGRVFRRNDRRTKCAGKQCVPPTLWCRFLGRVSENVGLRTRTLSSFSPRGVPAVSPFSWGFGDVLDSPLAAANTRAHDRTAGWGVS